MQMFLPPVLRPMSRDMRMEEVEQNHRQDITRSVNNIWASSETTPTCGLVDGVLSLMQRSDGMVG